MTYVGEQSGMLDEVLCSIADYYETDAKIRNKTKSAMIYPMFLAILMLAIVILMVAFVIPTFENSLAELDVEMPLLTMTIMWHQSLVYRKLEICCAYGGGAVVILIIVGKLQTENTFIIRYFFTFHLSGKYR